MPEGNQRCTFFDEASSDFDNRKSHKKGMIELRSFIYGTIIGGLIFTITGVSIVCMLFVENPDKNIIANKVELIEEYINNEFYYSVNYIDIADNVCKELMKSLEDDYTQYYTSEEYKQVLANIEGLPIDTANEEDILTVEGWLLNEKVGYIRIKTFAQNTVTHFEEQIKAVLENGAQSIIFDVRDNEGGLYHSAIEVLDRILPQGTLAYLEDKKGNQIMEESDERELEVPYVVLINEYTISAAELFAAVIQEYNTASIVGTKSYGKGVAQKIIGLEDGSAIRLTYAKYFLSSGKNIDGIGVIPDVNVSLKGEKYNGNNLYDTQLIRAIEIVSLKEEK